MCLPMEAADSRWPEKTMNRAHMLGMPYMLYIYTHVMYAIPKALYLPTVHLTTRVFESWCLCV